MSLKLGFANISPPFFLAARLCLEQLSELQSFSFKISSIITPYRHQNSVQYVSPCNPLLSYGMRSLRTLGSPELHQDQHYINSPTCFYSFTSQDY